MQDLLQSKLLGTAYTFNDSTQDVWIRQGIIRKGCWIGVCFRHYHLFLLDANIFRKSKKDVFVVPKWSSGFSNECALTHIKCYDSLKTPYQRIMESPYITDSVKQSLKEQFETLNPFRLRKIIEKKLKTIFSICYSKKPLITIPLNDLLTGNIY